MVNRRITIRCTRSRGPRGFFCLQVFRRGPVNVAVITLSTSQMKFHLSALVMACTIICLVVAWVVEGNRRVENELLMLNGALVWHEAMILQNLSISESSDLPSVLERKRMRMVITLFRQQSEMRVFTNYADGNEILKRQGYPLRFITKLSEDHTPKKMAVDTLAGLGCETSDDYFEIFFRLRWNEIYQEYTNGGELHEDFRSFLDHSIARAK